MIHISYAKKVVCVNKLDLKLGQSRAQNNIIHSQKVPFNKLVLREVKEQKGKKRV